MDGKHNTYWVVIHDGGLVALQAVSIDDPLIVGALREAKVILVPVTEFFPCSDCTCIEDCMGSQWAEGRAGGPTISYTQHVKLSAVSICELCGKHIFSTPNSSHVVYHTCPRQRMKGQDCIQCAVRRASWIIN